MSGDLEDFLRRAAQRRAEKAQQQAPAQPQRPTPEYSSRRQERIIREEPEDVVMAEVVEEDEVSVRRQREIEKAKQLAARARNQAKQQKRQATQAKAKPKTSTRTKAKSKASAAGKTASSAPASPVVTGNMAEDLIAMLRRPGGIQQAILLREILDRPEHRW